MRKELIEHDFLKMIERGSNTGNTNLLSIFFFLIDVNTYIYEIIQKLNDGDFANIQSHITKFINVS